MIERTMTFPVKQFFVYNIKQPYDAERLLRSFKDLL